MAPSDFVPTIAALAVAVFAISTSAPLIAYAAAPALAATGTATDRPSAADQAHGHDTAAGPIMVHVRDTRSGDIEVFAGTGQTRLRDKDLAARIARAIG